ncbi:MAG: hypothetical protein NZ484_01240 [Patescibacteria group bacterium]|nr:hypothetical protein [Patescibacteria group bacterium]MCX7589853.1 hypothetical protein [Patescibacteria group bacterium]MDW8279706.1 hypothetical protein [bacterium]
MSNQRNPWNAIVSTIIDPSLRKMAQKFAANIPEGHWLRTEVAERILAGLKGLAESYKGSGSSAIVIEKATDFLDFATGELFNKKNSSKSSVSASETAQKWIAKFWEESQKLFSQATPENLEKVKENIIRDFQARMEVFRIIIEAEKSLQPQKPEQAKSINWAEIDEKAAQWIERQRPSWLKRRSEK